MELGVVKRVTSAAQTPDPFEESDSSSRDWKFVEGLPPGNIFFTCYWLTTFGSFSLRVLSVAALPHENVECWAGSIKTRPGLLVSPSSSNGGDTNAEPSGLEEGNMTGCWLPKEVRLVKKLRSLSLYSISWLLLMPQVRCKPCTLVEVARHPEERTFCFRCFSLGNLAWREIPQE